MRIGTIEFFGSLEFQELLRLSTELDSDDLLQIVDTISFSDTIVLDTTDQGKQS